MKLYEIEYLDEKREEIMRNLRKKNANYSEYCKSEGELFARIKNIMASKGDIFISDQEKERITELMEQEEHVSPIKEREIYRQGYLDCLRLVVSLGK